MLCISSLFIHKLWRATRITACTMATKHQQPSNAELTAMIRSIVPVLSTSQHKGECGRIAVIGGCQEYTGAPYFAAYSALLVGCDLSHVFCARDAAPVIKSYSPELIVHPTLDSVGSQDNVCEWLDRMHSVVIGPGLGRDQSMLDAAKRALLSVCKKRKVPVVIDADGLYMLSCNPEILKGQSQVILTPNHVEFSRLLQAMGLVKEDWDVKGVDEGELMERVREVSESLGGVTVVLKGRTDIISNGSQVLVCDREGSMRRCGGQGDLLSGSLATFSFWSHQSLSRGNINPLLIKYGAEMVAGYAACALTRECAKSAFKTNHRSTTTSDLIRSIPSTFHQLFDS